MTHRLTLARAAAPLAVVLAFALAGCAAAETAVDEPAVEAPAPEPAVEAPAPEASAEAPTPDAPTDAADSPLAFTAVDIAGQPVDLAELAGEPVVLWFWAPWCSICRGEALYVADVAADLAGEVTFIGVAGLGERAAMQAFVADTGTGSFLHLSDDDGSIWQRFGVTYQPAYAFIGTDGSTDVHVGVLRDLAERAELL
jgi:thiol-disulfide isomerase/thioredoxin